MPLLLTYSVRNIRVRKLTTALTAGGIALVVFVFATVLMLNTGLKQTLASTGDDNNAIFIRRSAGTEVQSIVDRQQATIIGNDFAVMRKSDGLPLTSNEVVVMIALPKRETNQTRSIVARGIGPDALLLRPQIKIIEGRMFRTGSQEVIIGSRLGPVEVGSIIRFAQRDWHVVGRFDAMGSGFDSEIWGNSEQFMQAFRRNAFSSVVTRLGDTNHFEALKQRAESDPRLTVEVKREKDFYDEQSRTLSSLIKLLGATLSVMFSFGAIIGATITMYAAVASRKREIGTLRALGFRRITILYAFLAESVFISTTGWIVGLALAALFTNFQITTLNFTSFTEVTLQFILTPSIIFQSLIFSFLMGIIGGFLPAMAAARMKIVDALRSS